MEKIKHYSGNRKNLSVTTEVNFSSLERTLRIDSEFYSRENLEVSNVLNKNHLVSITDIALVSDGNHMKISNHFTEEEGVPYYRGQDIYNFFIEENEKYLKITEEAFDFPYLKRSYLQKGDVLLSIVGAIIGNLSLVKTEQKATCSCKLAILRPTSSVTAEYLAVFLQSKFGQNQIQKLRRGTAQTGLILEDFDQIKIPLLSEEFQNTITHYVNIAFDKLVAANKIYKSTEEEILKNLNFDFEDSKNNINIKSLSTSFKTSGRLDAEYYQPKYENIVNQIRELPHMKLKDLVSIKKSVEPGTENYNDEEGIPFLRVADFDKFQLYTPEKNLSHEYYEENKEKLMKLIPKKGTILFSKDGSVGIAHLLSKDEKFITSSAILHLNILEEQKIHPEYLTLLLNSKIVQMQAERDAGGSIIKHWRQSEIEEVLIPILNSEQQEKIKEMFNEGFLFRKQSKELLENAKLAIDIAVEKNEFEAIQFLDKISQELV